MLSKPLTSGRFFFMRYTVSRSAVHQPDFARIMKQEMLQAVSFFLSVYIPLRSCPEENDMILNGAKRRLRKDRCHEGFLHSQAADDTEVSASPFFFVCTEKAKLRETRWKPLPTHYPQRQTPNLHHQPGRSHANNRLRKENGTHGISTIAAED